MAILPEAEVTDSPTQRGGFRWFGLAMFGIGFWVYADGGGNTYSDWWVGRWGIVAVLVGGVVYLEGLAIKAVNSRSIQEQQSPNHKHDSL